MREKDRLRAQAQRDRDPEGNRRKQNRYYARHKERLRPINAEYTRRYYAANRDEILVRNKQPDRRAYKLRWYHEHKEVVRSHYEANRERILARCREYRESNRDKVRLLKKADKARRRSREVNAAGTASPEQIRARVAYYGHQCWMCRAPWEALDHVIPLSRGGSNWPANLRPACAPCNGRKWAHKLELKKAA